MSRLPIVLEFVLFDHCSVLVHTFGFHLFCLIAIWCAILWIIHFVKCWSTEMQTKTEHHRFDLIWFDLIWFDLIDLCFVLFFEKMLTVSTNQNHVWKVLVMKCTVFFWQSWSIWNAVQWTVANLLAWTCAHAICFWEIVFRRWLNRENNN